MLTGAPAELEGARFLLDVALDEAATSPGMHTYAEKHMYVYVYHIYIYTLHISILVHIYIYIHIRIYIYAHQNPACSGIKTEDESNTGHPQIHNTIQIYAELT